jgi:hypothetical protein
MSVSVSLCSVLEWKDLRSSRVTRARWRLAAAALLTLLLPVRADAQSAAVTYEYIGSPFTFCGWGCPGSGQPENAPPDWAADYIIVSMTFNAPLPPNLPPTDVSSSLIAWTMRDALGYFYLSSTAGDQLRGIPEDGAPPLVVSTDSDGDIVDYVMSTSPLDGTVGPIVAIVNPPFPCDECPGGSAVASFVAVDYGDEDIEWDAGASLPGQWSGPRDDLVVDFGPSYGIWLRRGNVWSQLHSLTSEGLVRVRSATGTDILAIDFGPGIGVWLWVEHAFWMPLHSLSPTAMVAADFNGDGDQEAGVFNFPGYGLWIFDSESGENGEWHLLHGLSASHLAVANLDGAGGQEVIVDFPGAGLWAYGAGSWSQLHGLNVTSVVTGDLDGNGSEDLIANFPGYGVWSYRHGVGWSAIHPFAATRLATGDLDGNGVVDLVIEFGSGAGVWVLRNGATWTQLHALATQNIVTGDLDGNRREEVIIDFGAPGLWSYEDGRGWQQINQLSPTAVATGRFH